MDRVETNRQRSQRLRRQRERAESTSTSLRSIAQQARRERERTRRIQTLQLHRQAAQTEHRQRLSQFEIGESSTTWRSSQFEIGESSAAQISTGFEYGESSERHMSSQLHTGESSTTHITSFRNSNAILHDVNNIVADDEYFEIPQQTAQLHVEGSHDLGNMDIVCEYCKALHWKAEKLVDSPPCSPKFGTCCLQGQIRLQPYEEPPPMIRALYDGNDALSKSFLDNIRQYNSAFAFTSLGFTGEAPILNGSGPYSYIIHGELRHRTGTLLPEEPHPPVYSQLYIYDPQYALQARELRNAVLMHEVLFIIQANLLHYNPFVPLFQQAYEILTTQEGDHENIQVFLHYTSQKDRRTYNQPTVQEVAIILPGDGTEISAPRDILLRLRNAGLVRINESNPLYLPLHYVLLFPPGELGYEQNLTHWNMKTDAENVKKRVTLMEFYSYRLFPRLNEYSTLFKARNLFQEFLVDAWAATEQNRLHYVRTHQADCRADLYKDLVALPDNDLRNANQIGQKIILPSSFTGSPRQMNEIYQDSMAITRHYSHPDIFLTMTANPQWPEIIRELGENQSPSDRPDIVARVFELKRKALMKVIKQRRIFGKVVAHVFTIEFQKRGLPHMHALFFLDTPHKIKTSKQVDRFISAELPDPEKDPTLSAIVKRRMIHGPCGERNSKAICMQGRICTKHFPKSFIQETSLDTDGYPIYRRREDGPSFYKGKNKIDNRDVVPYNPFLTKKFNCHINVEVCASIRCVKYINKYIYKGHDRATVVLVKRDEIKQYLDARYVGPVEVAWRIFGYPMHEEHPNVYRLDLHLPGEHRVVFKSNQTTTGIRHQAKNTRSKIMAFLDCCKLHKEARSLTYTDFPKYYSWQRNGKFWRRRKKPAETIGRMYFATPNSGERFYLRLLLIHFKGPHDWNDLKTFNGITHETFKQACVARGLLEDDGEWVECLREASFVKTGHQLRRLFAVILTQCFPSHPAELWEMFKMSICDDLQHRISTTTGTTLTEPEVTDYGLYLLDLILQEYGTCLKDFHHMPRPKRCWKDIPVDNKLIWEHIQLRSDPKTIDGQKNVSYLNKDQRTAFDEVMFSVNENKGVTFFINGGAGTGKTFLYNAIAGHCRRLDHFVICVASLGIAALLLVGGRTAHSTFCLPFDPVENSVCNFTKQSDQANLFRQAKLIIWDEVPMQNKYCIEAVDRTLKDVRDNNRPFGGLTVIFGGDFRQTLPLITKGTREQIVSATIRRSPIWLNIRVLHLSINMRLTQEEPENAEFTKYLLQIGTQPEELVTLPNGINRCSSLSELIDKIYPNLCATQPTSTYLTERVILAARNDDVQGINDEAVQQFPGNEVILLSADKNASDEGDPISSNRYPIEYLNTLNPSALPPSNLKLKVGCPVILLRNLQPKNGLCNGTRLKVIYIGQFIIEAEILTGDKAGSLVFIPRISLTPSSKESPVQMTRRQFPIRLAFALTINKSQGQSVKFVGIDLNTPVFSHGQLYVALSRCTTMSRIRILMPSADTTTTNVVYPEVLLS